MKPKLILLALVCCAVGAAQAVEYQAFRATVSLPLLSSKYVNTDIIVKTRLTNKQIINFALGRSFTDEVPATQVLVVLVPSAGPDYTGSRLAVIDTQAGTILKTIAIIGTLNILDTEIPMEPGVGVGVSTVAALANDRLSLGSFQLFGGGSALRTVEADGTSLVLKVKNLHGRFTRNQLPGQTTFFYANVITKAQLRVSGKSIATFDL
jgi:hypothetical protein